MAIEDGYQLSLTLDEAVHAAKPGATVDIEGALRKYQSVRVHHIASLCRCDANMNVHFCRGVLQCSAAAPHVRLLLSSSELVFRSDGEQDSSSWCCCHAQQRLVRASSIHGLAGMAAIMASTYKAYMGEGLGDFGKWLMKFKIPHFGKVRCDLCAVHVASHLGCHTDGLADLGGFGLYHLSASVSASSFHAFACEVGSRGEGSDLPLSADHALCCLCECPSTPTLCHRRWAARWPWT